MSNSDNKKIDCIDPNCSTCLMGASKTYKNKLLRSHITTFNIYTLGLVFRLIERKCSDKDYMLLERIKWDRPQFVYILEIQLTDNHPFNEILQKNNSDLQDKLQFDKYYASNFALQVTEILQKTFVKDIEKKIKRIQKTHNVCIQKISIVLKQTSLETLNSMISKYIDIEVINEIIQMNSQMNQV